MFSDRWRSLLCAGLGPLVSLPSGKYFGTLTCGFLYRNLNFFIGFYKKYFITE